MTTAASHLIGSSAHHASAAANEISLGAGLTQRINLRYDVTSAVSRAPADMRDARFVTSSKKLLLN